MGYYFSDQHFIHFQYCNTGKQIFYFSVCRTKIKHLLIFYDVPTSSICTILQTNKQTERQTNTQTDRQTNKQTNKQTNIYHLCIQFRYFLTFSLIYGYKCTCYSLTDNYQVLNWLRHLNTADLFSTVTHPNTF